MSKLKVNFLVLSIYLVVAVFFTYPIITDFNRYILGYPGDSLVNIWFYWWTKSYRPDILNLHTSLLNFPLGLQIGNIFLGPLLSTFLPLLLSFITNEIFAYNTYIFLSFLLAPMFTFLVALRLTKSVAGAFISGLIFGFSQYHLWQSFNHPDLASIQYLPLFFYSCLVYLEDCSKGVLNKKYLIFLALSFALVFHTSFYYAYFSFIAYVFVATIFLIHKKFKKLIYYLLPSLLFTLPVLPNFINLIQLSLSNGYISFPVNAPQRTISDLVAYGARPWDYILPSIYHPVFGQFVRSLYSLLQNNLPYQYWSTYLPERVNYLTITAVVISVFVVLKNLRENEFNKSDRKIILLLACVATFMLLVSLPATLTINGVELFFPSYLLFKFIPFFRVYSRAGVFVLLCVSLLSGYGIKYLFFMVGNKFNSSYLVKILFLIFPVVVLFENLNYPQNAYMDSYKVPKTYQWLKTIPGDFAVVDYPKDNSVNDIDGGCPSWLNENVVRDYNEAYSVFYQRIHGKKLFGYKSLPKNERSLLGDLSKEESYMLLKKYGVSYVLVHYKDPMVINFENPIDYCWQRRVMKKPELLYKKFNTVVEFDDGEVLKVN